MTSNKRFYLYNWITPILPDFGFFFKIRIWFLRFCGVVIDSSSNVSGSVRFTGSGEIVIGANSTIKQGGLINVGNGGKIVLGNNVLIAENVILESLPYFKGKSSLIFGDNIDFMMGSIASANGDSNVFIGSNCKIAHNVSIKATEHRISLEGDCIAGECVYRDITVSSGCWICAGVIIIPGVKVGKRNVIAAGAVVTINTPDNVLVAGVPASIKKVYS